MPGHYPGTSPPAMYILTSAAGVTSCRAIQDNLDHEVARFPHVHPIRVDHWVKIEEGTRYARWKRTETFEWRLR